MPDPHRTESPMTVPAFVAAKQRGEKLSMLTAYDYTMARCFDAAGIDAILVGDSLGMVVQGHEHPLKVTLDAVIYHARCVARGVRRALVIGDLPFLTYQASAAEALRNAGRLLQEGDVHAVKLEGGARNAKAIAKMTAAGIPVMGHVGMTPQSVRQYGGFKVQRDRAIVEEARAVAEAGAFAVVLECVPAALAAEITAQLPIPTIGIGAGAGCDGQVLVAHDMLGLFDDVRPRFVKRYAELGGLIRQAAADYRQDVRDGTFPGAEHEFK